MNSETTITSVARIVRQSSPPAAANQWIEYLAYDAAGQLLHSITFHGPAEGIAEDRRDG